MWERIAPGETGKARAAPRRSATRAPRSTRAGPVVLHGGLRPGTGPGAKGDRLVSEVTRPLQGLRVVDCTVERGELSARLLADLGAEVVKVEPPRGSPARALAPVRTGVSLAWAVRNAGKLGVVLDLDGRGRPRAVPHAARPRRRARHVRRRAPGSGSTRARSRRVTRISSSSRSRRSVSTARSPSTSPPTRCCRRPVASRSRPESRPTRRLFPPGHLVDDLVSVTADVRRALRALPARADRCRAVRRVVGERGGRALRRLGAPERERARTRGRTARPRCATDRDRCTRCSSAPTATCASSC